MLGTQVSTIVHLSFALFHLCFSKKFHFPGSTDSCKSPSAVIVGDTVQFRKPSASGHRSHLEPVNAGSLTTSTGQSQFFGTTAGFEPVPGVS